MEPPATSQLRVDSELRVVALPGVPTVDPGDDLVAVVHDSLRRNEIELRSSDVLVIASKVVSRAEGCFVDLASVTPSERARRLAAETDKDPRLVELILRESTEISRTKPGALIVRHRLGFVSANAGIDSSNATPSNAPRGSGPWVLTLPRDPNATAAALRDALKARFSAELGVVITDSWGRPFRRGTMGFAIGVAGLPPVWDRRGAADRHGRVLESTELAVADAVAAAADLVAGQADESRPLLLVRGVHFEPSTEVASALLRDPESDLYA
jgi:coenzyme F420-0:L-glutamate ligase/coenzyme F420-1:gamma-L-glutamate ligase